MKILTVLTPVIMKAAWEFLKVASSHIKELVKATGVRILYFTVSSGFKKPVYFAFSRLQSSFVRGPRNLKSFKPIGIEPEKTQAFIKIRQISNVTHSSSVTITDIVTHKFISFDRRRCYKESLIYSVKNVTIYSLFWQ
jgi:hypothetical protein